MQENSLFDLTSSIDPDGFSVTKLSNQRIGFTIQATMSHRQPSTIITSNENNELRPQHLPSTHLSAISTPQMSHGRQMLDITRLVQIILPHSPLSLLCQRYAKAPQPCSARVLEDSEAQMRFFLLYFNLFRFPSCLFMRPKT